MKRPDVRPTDDLPRAAAVPTADEDAARRAVLWRVDRRRLTAAQARTVLDMLGLLPEPAGEVQSW